MIGYLHAGVKVAEDKLRQVALDLSDALARLDRLGGAGDADVYLDRALVALNEQLIQHGLGPVVHQPLEGWSCDPHPKE